MSSKFKHGGGSCLRQKFSNSMEEGVKPMFLIDDTALAMVANTILKL